MINGPNLDEVGRLAKTLQQTLSADPGLGRMDLDLQLDLPQLVLDPDRTRIASAGLTTQDVALALNMLSGGVDIAKFNDVPGDGQRYDIRVKAKDGEFTAAFRPEQDLPAFPRWSLVRLDTVASVKQTLGPAVIGRFDLQYAATFYGTPTIPLGDAVNKVKAAAAEILPIGYTSK